MILCVLIPTWWKFFRKGYPTCHCSCARNYYKVLWDIGPCHETSFTMGLN